MTTAFCQSCAMPLAADEHLGTNADGTKNPEYCCYCYTKGEYAQNCTMEEMIEHCLLFLDEFNKDAPTPLTLEQAREQMTAFFPQLKRWQNAASQ